MFKKTLQAVLCLLLLPHFVNAKNADETGISTIDVSDISAQQASSSELSQAEQYRQWAISIWESLDQKSGEITLADDAVKLNVPEAYYFLNAQDSQKVLVDVWGNPPDESVLGMLFPQQATPFDSDAWAVTISYEQDGYVKDTEADSINYDELLKQMQKDAIQANQKRQELGYPSIEIIAWASTPFYDKNANKLHWAKELKFKDSEMHTLNYDLRVLGRKGVLVMSFIADMQQLTTIQEKMPEVLAIAEFQEGSRYADFDPELDKVAAYGIGALIAGKALVKTGLIATAIVILKKFGIYIIGALGMLFFNLFKRKKQKASAAPTLKK